MTPCTAPRCGDAARWTVADRHLCRRHMLDALLAGRIGQVHAVPLEAESLEVEPEPVARLTDEQREAIAYGVMLCDATAGMANDRATIDGASRAADVLRGLLERQE